MALKNVVPYALLLGTAAAFGIWLSSARPAAFAVTAGGNVAEPPVTTGGPPPDEAPSLKSLCHGKATVVLFKADWCGWCRKLQAETLKDPKVVERLKPYELQTVDVDEQPGLSAAAQVNGVPMTLVLSKDCKKSGVIEGYRPSESFLDALGDIESGSPP